MIYLVAFVVLVLATARLTRLICKDDITASMRLAIDRRFGEQSFISRLIWCHWCVAVWVSLFTSSIVLGMLDLSGVISTAQQAALWLLLVPANAYAASWVVDKEGE